MRPIQDFQTSAEFLGNAEFVALMLAELAAARQKHPGEEGVLTDAEWLAVLTEEVGECARAIQDESDDALRKELAQVACVALRWFLSIPAGRQRPPWSKTETPCSGDCGCQSDEGYGTCRKLLP